MNQETDLTPERNLASEISFHISERQSKIDLMKDATHFMRKYWDEQDPTMLPKLIELYEQEITALYALDPQAATLDEVRAVSHHFHKQREALDPNRP